MHLHPPTPFRWWSASLYTKVLLWRLNKKPSKMKFTWNLPDLAHLHVICFRKILCSLFFSPFSSSLENTVCIMIAIIWSGRFDSLITHSPPYYGFLCTPFHDHSTIVIEDAEYGSLLPPPPPPPHHHDIRHAIWIIRRRDANGKGMKPHKRRREHMKIRWYIPFSSSPP